MRITLRVWRQTGPNTDGAFQEFPNLEVNEHMSVLEVLDVVNSDLESKGEEPIVFDHDCREGICGACGAMLNGYATAPVRAPRCASCTCGASPTATPSRSSRGGPRPSRSSAT